MEPLRAVELFKRAPVQSNCPAKYAVFIGDDDCSTLSKIREEVFLSCGKMVILYILSEC